MLIRAVLALLFYAVLSTGGAVAQPFNEGYRKCEKCHEAEVEVWKKTQHFKGFQEIHKSDKAKKILAAAGGATSMRANANCVMCHFTETKTSAAGKPQVSSGPSCESCHGPSSEWRDVHNFYGDGIDDPKKEPAARRDKRYADARKAGMIWSFMTYDIAANCMECHGLANPKLKPDVLAKMLEAGHPGEPEFELVAHSQGSVRHRFYPPNVNTNAELNAAELSRLYVIGQAAKLVSATAAAAGGSAQFTAMQKKRAQDARAALQPVADLPEVKAVLDKPSADAGRRLAEALKGKDLSAKVKLPAKSSYK